VQSLAKGDAQVMLRSGASVPCSRQFRGQLMQRLKPGA
jgi:two-component system LytT family response regulator